MTGRRVEGPELLLVAVDALEGVLLATSREEAQANARSMVAELDEWSLREIVGILAWTGVELMHRVDRNQVGKTQRRLDRWRVEGMARLNGSRER